MDRRERHSCDVRPRVLRSTRALAGAPVSPLWPHQEEGVQRALANMPGGFGFFFEQRGGKSRAATEAAKRLGAKRILVLCPSQAGAVPKVWMKEIPEQWIGSPPILNLGIKGESGASKARRLAKHGPDRPLIAIVNYESMWLNPLAELLTSMPWDVLICDESHRLKAPKGKQAAFAARIARLIPNRFLLTGTPNPHSPLDTWAQYQVLDWTVFPSSYTKFRLRYSRPAEYGERKDKDIYMMPGRGGVLNPWKFRDLDHMRELMYGGGKRAMRVLTRDVFPDMPHELTDERRCELEPAARRAYREMERHMVAELGADEASTATAANGGVKQMRLQQITGGTLPDMDGELHTISTAKETLLGEVMEDFGDEPMIVIARFHSDLDAIHRACAAKKLTSLELSGRRSELEEWKAGEAQVLAVQIQAGGAGIDLTRASVAIFYSVTSLGDYEQVRFRILGPMQTKPALLLHLVVEGTVDQAIYPALRDRKDVVSTVVEYLRHAAEAAPLAEVHA